MIPVLTADEMRRADRRTIDEIGLPGPVLMENAGAAVARLVEERFPQARRVVVLCGRGNNGGDGFVVARRLGGRARAFLLGAREGVEGDARTHLRACERSGGRVSVVPDAAAWAAALRQVEDADVIVDAVLGTGLALRADAGSPGTRSPRSRAGSRPASPSSPWTCRRGCRPTAGPSTGRRRSPTVTVTFAAPKRGHVLPPACHHVGELVVADIGISPESLAASGPSLFLVEDRDVAGAFPLRRRGAHKGDFGHVLIVAGSLGKTGAAVLAAGGALRAGAGLVTVATPEPCLPVVAAARAEAMTEPLPATRRGGLDEAALPRLLDLAGRARRRGAGPRPRPGAGNPGAGAGVRAGVPRAPRDRRGRPQRPRGDGGRRGGPRRAAPGVPRPSSRRTPARWPASRAGRRPRSRGAGRKRRRRSRAGRARWSS